MVTTRRNSRQTPHISRRIRGSSHCAAWVGLVLGATLTLICAAHADVRYDGPRELQAPPGKCYVGLAFSPDGQRLALSMADGESEGTPAIPGAPAKFAEIGVLNRDGSEFRLVAPRDANRTWIGPIGWSPDGSRLLVQYEDKSLKQEADVGGPTFAVVDIAECAIEPVVGPAANRPRWLPLEAHTSANTQEGAIQGLDAARGYEADASPRDWFLVYAVDEPPTRGTRERPQRLWSASSDGSKAELLMSSTEFGRIVPAPTRLLAAVLSRRDRLALVGKGDSHLTRVEMEDGDAAMSLRVAGVAWSPDSKSLALVARTRPGRVLDEGDQIWILDVVDDQADDVAQQEVERTVRKSVGDYPAKVFGAAPWEDMVTVLSADNLNKRDNEIKAIERALGTDIVTSGATVPLSARVQVNDDDDLVLAGTGGNVGIGTIVPTAPLDVAAHENGVVGRLRGKTGTIEAQFASVDIALEPGDFGIAFVAEDDHGAGLTNGVDVFVVAWQGLDRSAHVARIGGNANAGAFASGNRITFTSDRGFSRHDLTVSVVLCK